LAGHPEGMCGAAGMLVKGEGTEDNRPNVSRAVELYENASTTFVHRKRVHICSRSHCLLLAIRGSVRALNGLGYIYFYGQGLEKNVTKAFEYFLQAAEAESDGDALFNAAYCLETGLGVAKDSARAVGMYRIAAKKFGHFASVRSLGALLMEVRMLCTLK